MFSDVVGHVGLGNYLLHRFVFLSWGIGICLWAVGNGKTIAESDWRPCRS